MIAATVEALRRSFPDAEVIVADDGSRDATADRAEAAGATVLRLERRGKGQALSAAERAAPPGSLLLVDADLRGDLSDLVADSHKVGMTIAAFSTRTGGGSGSRSASHARSSGRGAATSRASRSPDSGFSRSARGRPCSRSRRGFGAETRMTIDAVRAGIRVEEVELDLGHRATGRDVRGFVHRGRQLAEAVLASGPLRVNYRGSRLPLVGWTAAFHEPLATAIGLADDAWSGPERGFRAHLRAGRTTGVLKLVGIPLVGLVRTRSVSGALLVGLSANFLNQLDTRPGRALKAYVLGAAAVDAPLGLAVLLLPYDLREMGMLGDSGSNGLGALLGLYSVNRFTGRGRWVAISALAGLTLLGESRSLGELIERTPGLRELDSLGRRRSESRS